MLRQLFIYRFRMMSRITAVVVASIVMLTSWSIVSTLVISSNLDRASLKQRVVWTNQAWGQPNTIEQVEAIDHLKRSRQLAPKLTALSVFRWGLLNHSERRYGVYGRAIPTTDSEGLPAALMYRGEMVARLSWLQKSWLDSETQPLEIDSKSADIPSDLNQLNDKLIVLNRSYQITADPVSEMTAKSVTERRVYQAYSPYQLVAISAQSTSVQGVEHDHYWRGKWTHQDHDGRIKEVEIKAQETLLSQYLFVDHLHVGGAYRTWLLERGEAHEVEVKVIDRRFEKIGGLWSEVVEVERINIKSKQSVSFIFSRHGSLRAQRLSPELILVVGTTRNLKRRRALPLHKRPLELRLLQRRAGHLPGDILRKAFENIGGLLNQCISQKTKYNPEVFLRLDLNQHGRLLAASATHLSPWPLSRCVLSKLKKLRLPAPKNLESRRHTTSFKDELRGATIGYRVTLPLMNPHHENVAPPQSP